MPSVFKGLCLACVQARLLFVLPWPVSAEPLPSSEVPHGGAYSSSLSADVITDLQHVTTLLASAGCCSRAPRACRLPHVGQTGPLSEPRQTQTDVSQCSQEVGVYQLCGGISRKCNEKNPSDNPIQSQHFDVDLWLEDLFWRWPCENSTLYSRFCFCTMSWLKTSWGFLCMSLWTRKDCTWIYNTHSRTLDRNISWEMSLKTPIKSHSHTNENFVSCFVARQVATPCRPWSRWSRRSNRPFRASPSR